MSDFQKRVFDRSGLACLSDLETSEWRELFTLLEKEQAVFLEKETHFRSPEYKWPRDALHTWSRIWEYPYCYYHLKIWRGGLGDPRYPVVADVGSGVTFFPFCIAQMGCHVICTDIDPVCSVDLHRATEHVTQAPGEVEFRLAEEFQIPLASGEADAAYCISLFEHVSNYEIIIREIARILKPGGLFVVTMDLALEGSIGLDMKEYKAIASFLGKYFEFKFPETTAHPSDLLHSKTGLLPTIPSTAFWLIWFNLKQRVLKPLLGLKPITIAHLTFFIQGAVLIRK